MRSSGSQARLAGMAALLLMAPCAHASDLGADFMACVGIQSAARRLSCYDSVASTSKTLPQAARPDFAPDKPLHVRAKPVEEPAAIVGLVSVRTNGDGKPVFTLANGQVWQGQDDDPVYPNPSGNVVTITRSSLGLGYRLRMNQQTAEFTVRRIE